MILFLIIPAYILINCYLLHRIYKWLTACSGIFHSRKFVIPYITVYTLLALSLLFAFMLPSCGLQVAVKRLSNYWLGTFLYILMFVAIADICRLILKRIHGRIHDFFFSKKGYVFTGIFLTILTAVFSIYGSVNAKLVRVTPYEVTIDKECPGIEQLKIALIADLHLGYSVGNAQMRRMVEKVNAMEPDLILVAGDIFDNEYEAVQNPDKIAVTLSQMKSKYGVYGVFGNHDVTERLLGGFSVPSPEEEVRDPRFEEFARKAGIQILDDEVVCIEDAFYLVGRKDAQKTGDGEGRLSPEAILGQTDTNLPVIVMEHQPRQLQQLADAGADMQLCGHTHDGQIFPGNLVIPFFWENPCGLLVKDQMYSIVTSGVGVWGPAMRVGTASEVCEITVNFNA